MKGYSKYNWEVQLVVNGELHHRSICCWMTMNTLIDNQNSIGVLELPSGCLAEIEEINILV